MSWVDTGQLGFTQTRVLDYTFNPGVPRRNNVSFRLCLGRSKSIDELYLNGGLAGTREAVSEDFSMPAGLGWLGANTSGTEGMVKDTSCHRLPGHGVGEVILDHADAFNDVTRPPRIRAFVASADTVFTPGSATLSWDVENASAVFVNGPTSPPCRTWWWLQQ